MTPKEKSKELVNKLAVKDELGWYVYSPKPFTYAKECALIAVDEILWILNELNHHNDVESEMYFYNEVKEEIVKL